MKKFFKIAMILFLCGTVFFVSSFFYLNFKLKESEIKTDNAEHNIPYFYCPQNCGIMIFLPNEKNVLFYLDFEQEMSYIININNYKDSLDSYVGYPIDYNLTVDYYTLSLIFDRVGGIDLQIGDEIFRYTGIQVCDMLSGDSEGDFHLKVITAFCERLSTNGFSGEDFKFLLSHSATDLKMPVCLYWQDYIESMFSNTVFVNWET